MERQKEKTSGIYKFGTAVGTVLCIILIPVLIINGILIFRSYTDTDKVPQIAGIVPMIVLTDSMYPTIQSGDLILCHAEDAKNVRTGDVISFFDPAGDGSSVVTHRVVDITEAKNGTPAWVTRGDANNAEDPEPVPAENLVGVYRHRFAKLGYAAMFMQTTQGLILCVICPIILLIVYDRIRRRISEKSEQKDTAALIAELEVLRAEKENRTD